MYQEKSHSKVWRYRAGFLARVPELPPVIKRLFMHALVAQNHNAQINVIAPSISRTLTRVARRVAYTAHQRGSNVPIAPPGEDAARRLKVSSFGIVLG